MVNLKGGEFTFRDTNAIDGTIHTSRSAPTSRHGH
jgi:hypothetical protein